MNLATSHIEKFIQPCPICKNATGFHLDKIKFQTYDGSSIPGDFTLAFCGDCGHIFYDNNLTEEQITYIYVEKEYNTSNIHVGSGSQTDADITHQREIIQRIKEWYDNTENGIIFDIGAGRGGLTKELIQSGYKNVIAIEPSARTVELLKNEKLTAYAGSAQNLPKINLSPSLAVYSHVLEHLLYPATALTEIKKFMAPGGLVYIELPDAGSYPAETPPFYYLYLEHLQHFTSSSLNNMLILSGFEVLKLGKTIFHTAEKDGFYTPVLYAIARLKPAAETSRSDDPSAPALNHIKIATENIQEDFSGFSRYLELSKNSSILEKLDNIAKSHEPLWIWGVTQLLQLLIGQNYISIKNIAGFIDKDTDKQRRTILGKKIHPTEILNNFTKNDRVLLMFHGIEHSVKSYLTEIDFKGQVLTLTGD
ncbi:MAG: class I SAM-dependent methyltransferase [Deltaproteobacteria bacterium]|jgi:SAM-dependent methyltransferase|nr:class I SAM-dependent methyltransferase [Deltaproteobacteria bacterium]